MGVITDLIQAHRQKEADDVNRHIDANKFVLSKLAEMTEEDAVKQGYDSVADMKAKIAPVAIDNITQTLGKHGGKQGKGAGGIIKMMLSGLAGLNPMPGDPNKGQEVPQMGGGSDSAAGRPQRSTAQTDAIMRQKQQQKEADAVAHEQGLADARAKGQIDAKVGELAATQKAAEQDSTRRLQLLEQNKDLFTQDEYADLYAQASDIGKMSTQRNPTEVQAEQTARLQMIAEERGVPIDKLTPQDRVLAVLIGKDSPEVRLKTEQNRLSGMGIIEARNKAVDEAGTASKFSGDLKTQIDTQEIITHPEKYDAATVEAAAREQKRLNTAQTSAGLNVTVKQQGVAAGAAGTTGGITDDELRNLAKESLITGKNPAFGLSAKDPTRSRYNKIKADLIGETGPEEAAEKSADFTSLSRALNDQVKRRGQIVSFEGTATKNMDQVLALSKQVGRTGSSLANEYLLWTEGKLTDYPLLSRYKTAVNTATNEYAKIVNSATGGGTSTVDARKDAQDLLNTSMAKGSVEGAVQQMKIDMKNRHVSLDQEIEATKKQMKGGGGPAGDSGGELPKPKKPGQRLSATDAKAYIDASGGDKEAARQAAKADGWSF